MTNSLLSQKAVIADVIVRHWTGRKLDRKVTDEVNTNHGADADAGRYNKLLIAKEAFSDIYKLVGEARREHHLLTLPWADSGFRILPTTLYDNFAMKFRALRIDYSTAADQFDQLYPQWMAGSRKRLKGMFNQDDYPDPSRVRSMFSFSVVIRPCPDADDFRVTLAKEHLQDVRDSLREEMEAAVQETLREPARRIIETVGKMAVKLKEYKVQPGKRFNDTLVSNIEELVPLLEAFNLTKDAGLTNLTKRIQKELCKHEPGTLRENDDVRKQVATSAEDILKQAEAMMA